MPIPIIAIYKSLMRTNRLSKLIYKNICHLRSLCDCSSTFHGPNAMSLKLERELNWGYMAVLLKGMN